MCTTVSIEIKLLELKHRFMICCSWLTLQRVVISRDLRDPITRLKINH